MSDKFEYNISECNPDNGSYGYIVRLHIKCDPHRWRDFGFYITIHPIRFNETNWNKIEDLSHNYDIEFRANVKDFEQKDLILRKMLKLTYDILQENLKKCEHMLLTQSNNRRKKFFSKTVKNCEEAIKLDCFKNFLRENKLKRVLEKNNI